METCGKSCQFVVVFRRVDSKKDKTSMYEVVDTNF